MTRPLHVQRIGKGPPLVLIHGWAQHSGFFASLNQMLADRFTLVAVDLPGHGHSRDEPKFDLPSVVQRLRASIDEPALWLGWSLGGLVALQMALSYPRQVKALSLVTTSPRFVQTEDWPGILPMDLDGFGNELKANFQLTLRRFAGLQAWGLKEARVLVRHFMALVAGAPPPMLAGVRSGLAILHHTDLRHRLNELSMPVQWLFGGRDRLVPAAIADKIPSLMPAAEIELIEQASHAPLLSHPKLFEQRVVPFLEKYC